MDDEFEILRKEYLVALGKRAKEVAKGFATLKVGVDVEVGGDVWTSILYVAHKTAGLAATYDLPRLTDLCAAIDEGMQNIKSSGTLQVPFAEFKTWCETLRLGLLLGSQGKDADDLQPPIL